MDYEDNSVYGEVAPAEEYSYGDDGDYDFESDEDEVAASENYDEPSYQRQSKEENAVFAKIRRDAEASARARYEPQIAELSDYQEMKDELQEWGYEGSPREIALALRAQKQGVSVGEILEQDEMQREYEFMLENNPDITRAREATEEANRIIFERQFENDLASIKREYPDLKAESVTELGDVYMSLMASAEASGMELDPVAAYVAQMEQDKRTTKETPPSMGSASSLGGNVEKEFYTSAEVDRLTERQLSDPKVFERVRRSMTQWK